MAEWQPHERRPRVLYVDDEEQNLTVFEAAYEDVYDIFTATSARDALKILEKERIDLIITDQRMPQMTGVQMIEAIGEDYPDTVRMILTGFADVEAIIQAINTGRVDQYLTKPYDVDVLKMTLDRALELQAIRRRNRELIAEREEHARRAQEIRQAFQKYVPEAVVQDTLKRGGDVMAGEARLVSVMFTNIVGFKDFHSRLGPDKLVEFLNEYFTRMTAIILEKKGMVAEFISDGIHAVFGAPRSTLDNEANALAAAVDMVEAAARFSEEVAVPMLGAPIRISIGINRGEVIAGNLGSLKKMKYGVIGDAVNVASRIRDQADPARSDIIIGDSVKEWGGEGFELESLGPTALRGKDETVELYRVLGRS